MSDNGKLIPFQAVGVPVLGQPFVIRHVVVPVNATLSCNCGGPETTVTIVGSVPSGCPSCGQTFNITYDPSGSGRFAVNIIPRPSGEVAS